MLIERGEYSEAEPQPHRYSGVVCLKSGWLRKLQFSDSGVIMGPQNFNFALNSPKYINNILVALFVPLILVNVLQIFGTASQLIPIFRRSLDLAIV